LAGFIAQVVQHLFWPDVFTRHFLLVEKPLPRLQHLMITDLNHLAKLSFFFIKLCVHFLLLAQFGSRL
jgi:hypothetical protein